MAKRARKIFALPLSRSGATVYLVMGLLIAVGSVILYVMDFGRNMENTSRLRRIIVEKEDLRRVLDTIFSNRDLCLAHLRVNGNQFHLEDILKPNERYLRSFQITDMRIDDVKQLNPLLKSGRFVVRFETGTVNSGPAGNEISRVINFKEGRDNRVTECVGRVEASAACARLGLTWNPDLKVCDICSALGHRWVGKKCV